MQPDLLTTLPTPDDASARHSERCAAFIRERIRDSGGAISFAEFMQHALYAPGLGYYTAGATKLGREGDFITAPEASSLFGRVLAGQCAQVLETLGGGEILEFGAGSGKLAVDVLTKLDETGALPDAYRILEVSPDLRDRQQRSIGDAPASARARVQWIDRLPQDFRGVVIANEVLDAMPVERFVRRDDIRQQAVVVKGSDFAFAERDAPEFLLQAVAAIEDELGGPLADGYVSEHSPGAASWIGDVTASMSAGVAFLFDYGVTRREYYAADRRDGWLRCHFRHRAHGNPLTLPGIQDITAWVDFSAIAATASRLGADVAGYTSQAQFLLGGGLDVELQSMHGLGEQQRLELSGQVKLLTLPGEMGERFKCLALASGNIDAPDAFQLADRTHTL